MGTNWKVACAALAVLLVGVSGVFFIWNGKLNSANTRITNLNKGILSLSGENVSLQASLDKETTGKSKALFDLSTMTTQQQQTQITLNQAQAQVTGLQGQLNALQGQLADSKAQLTSAQSQLAAANNQLTSAQSQLATANTLITGLQGQVASAQGQLAAAQSQLSALQSKYPLKDFASLSDLSAWVKAHLMASTTDVTPSLNECLSVQKQAMLDGYFVSVIFEPLTSTTYDIYLEAIASGTLYAWGVDNATLYNFWDGMTR
jgi:chromosome segregation ATPase